VKNIFVPRFIAFFIIYLFVHLFGLRDLFNRVDNGFFVFALCGASWLLLLTLFVFSKSETRVFVLSRLNGLYARSQN
jgi:hypothetical protein